MKVLVAHNLYSSAQPSGENAVVTSEIRALGEAGITVIPYLRSSDEIAAMSLAVRAALPLSPIYARQAQRELDELLVTHRPDVLHLHNPYPLLSPWVIRTAHHRGVPVVQTVHNFRHECVAGVYFRDGSPCRDCSGKLWSGPAIRHRCYRGSLPQTLVMAATLAIHRQTWLQVDRFIALSPQIVDFLRSIGVSERQIALRPNAVPDPGLPSRGGDGFLFAGRLSPEKGLALLIEAWRQLAEGAAGHLVIAGDGEMRPQVEVLAANRSDVTYAGQLTRTELATAMRAAAVIVVPSVSDDVLPTIAIEAMAHGKPVLATDRGGLPWVVGDAGWIVSPVASSLAAGLSAARSGAAALSPLARRRYEEEFGPVSLLERLLQIYRGAVAQPVAR